MDLLFLLDWKEDIGQHLKYMIVDLELTKLKISQLLVFNLKNFISFVTEMYKCLHFHFYSFFNRLCTNHYHASPTILFSPFNTYFLVSTGYCTWSNFLISSTHHS
jgi:hypothetical protein